MIDLRTSLAEISARCRHCTPRNMAITLVVVVALLLGTSALVGNLTGLPDMTAYEQGAERKAAFFDYLKPIVDSQNQAILSDRDKLLGIANDLESADSPSFLQKWRLESLARDYAVEWNEAQISAVVDELQRRVDAVPIALVLVQAAKESGWGTSKFAREGNNLFGQWCYREGCGIVPEKRKAGATHEVQVFASVDDAIAAYLHNINTGKAYKDLRSIRASARSADREPKAAALADGLILYSERRQAYVDEVKQMIRQYHDFEAKQTG